MRPGRRRAAKARLAWPAGPPDPRPSLSDQGPRPATGPRHVPGLARTAGLASRSIGSVAGRGRRGVDGAVDPRRRLAAGRSDRAPVAAPRGSSWCSTSPSRGCWRSSGSSGDPETGCGSPTAGCSWPTTRPGCRATRRTRRSQAGGHGAPVDSRRYGPVTVDALVARAWFRYWPARRIGRIGRAGADEATPPA